MRASPCGWRTIRSGFADIRVRLAANRDMTPLFDTADYTRQLEAAYLTMWERHLKGEPPASFTVEAQR